LERRWGTPTKEGKELTGIRRILAIDGGGIRGVMPAAFLAEVERIADTRVVDNFDLIAGTSTGGIIALGLGLGMTAAEILEFYRSYGPTIFSQEDRESQNSGIAAFVREKVKLARHLMRPKHDADLLQGALQQAFGKRTLGESQTRLLIPAYDPDRRTVYIFKTSHHERLEVDHRRTAVDVAMATAAAPTFFAAYASPTGAPLIDGGVWANNPVGLAVVEAVGVLEWDRANLRVLSLGCGDDIANRPIDGGLSKMGLKIVGLFMEGQSLGAHGTAKILAGYENVHRISLPVPEGKFSLDDTSKMGRLAGIGAGCAREELPMLRGEFLTGSREPFVPFH
jgi:uncharacterized protein